MFVTAESIRNLFFGIFTESGLNAALESRTMKVWKVFGDIFIKDISGDKLGLIRLVPHSNSVEIVYPSGKDILPGHRICRSCGRVHEGRAAFCIPCGDRAEMYG